MNVVIFSLVILAGWFIIRKAIHIHRHIAIEERKQDIEILNGMNEDIKQFKVSTDTADLLKKEENINNFLTGENNVSKED